MTTTTTIFDICDEKKENVELIHKITEFLSLKDIINLQKTSKHFRTICKINTNEIINNNIYKNYSKNYYTMNGKNELQNIKKLKLNFIDQNMVQIYTSTIKNSIQLKFLSIKCYPFVNYMKHLNDFASNIPKDVQINYLNFNFNYHKNLSLKCVGRIEFYKVKITNELFKNLTITKIKEIYFSNCSFEEKINEIKWKSIAKFIMDNNEIKFQFDNQSKIELHTPNLKEIEIKCTNKLSEIFCGCISFGIKKLILSKFSNSIGTWKYFDYFNIIKKINHKFESVWISLENSIPTENEKNYYFNLIWSDILRQTEQIIFFDIDKIKIFQEMIKNSLKKSKIKSLVKIKNSDGNQIKITKLFPGSDSLLIEVGI